MNQDNQINFSIVGIIPSNQADVAILLNVYEEPMDSESISSAIHTMTVGEQGCQAGGLYNTNEWLTAASAVGGTVYAASMDSNVHVFDGSQWTLIPTKAASGLNCVHAVESGLAYAVALDGNIHEIAAGSSKLVHQGKGVRLNWVHGCSPNCVYAVGDEGQVCHFDGSAWTRLPQVTNVNLLTVLCLAPNDVYVAGSGVAFRWNGHHWLDINGGAITISSLAVYKGKLYAAAGKDGVHVLDGGSFQPFKALTLYKLCMASDWMFATGAKLFAWFDGSQWRGGPYALG